MYVCTRLDIEFERRHVALERKHVKFYVDMTGTEQCTELHHMRHLIEAAVLLFCDHENKHDGLRQREHKFLAAVELDHLADQSLQQLIGEGAGAAFQGLSGNLCYDIQSSDIVFVKY